MTPDAGYVSLNFNNPELKKIEPWAGTHKGPQSLPEVFAGIQSFWKTLDFKVTDTIEQSNRVAFFGAFTLQINTAGKEITSPFGVLARFEGDKVAHLQFLEDSSAPQAHSKQGSENMPVLVVALPEQVGDHERATSFQSRSPNS